jgi:WD40 repeat protein
LLPVLRADGYNEALLPNVIKSPQWTYLRANDDFETEIKKLVDATNTDFELLEIHTWLTQRDDEWKNGRGGLLTGNDLKRASDWLPKVSQNPLRLPNVTPSQMEFISASERGRARRAWWTAGATAVLLLLVSYLGIRAVLSSIENNRLRLAAETDLLHSYDQQAKQLVMLSRQDENEKRIGSALVSLAAAKDKFINSDVIAQEFALSRPGFRLAGVFPATFGRDASLALTKNGRQLAVGLTNTLVLLLDTMNGRTNAVLGPHLVVPTSLAFSATGHLLAVGAPLTPSTTRLASGLQAAVQMWNVDTKTPMKQYIFTNVFAPVEALAISPDGTQLAAAIISHVAVWNIASSRDLFGRGLVAPTDIASLSYSHNGKWLAARCRTGQILLWDATTGAPISKSATVRGDVGGLTRPTMLEIGFSPDDQLIASSSQGFFARILGVPTLTNIQSLNWHSGVVSSVTWIGTNGLLLSGAWDRDLCLGDARAGDVIERATAGRDGVKSILASEDGITAIVQDYSGYIRKWRVTAPSYNAIQPREPCLIQQYANAGDTLFTRALPVWAPGDPPTRNAPRSPSLTMGLIDGTSLNEIPWPVNVEHVLSILPGTTMEDCGKYVLATAGGKLQVRDLCEKQILFEMPSNQPLPMAVGLGGQFVAVAQQAGPVPTNGFPETELYLWQKSLDQMTPVPESRGVICQSISFSADGHWLAAANLYGAVDCWAMPEMTRRRLVDPILGAPAQIAFLPHGRKLLVEEGSGQLTLFDPQKPAGAGRESLPAVESGIGAFCIHPDGQTLAASTRDGSIWLFDLEHLTIITHFNPMAGRILSLSVRPDGRVLAGGTRDGHVLMLGGWMNDADQITSLHIDTNTFEPVFAEGRPIRENDPFSSLPPPLDKDDVVFWRLLQNARNLDAKANPNSEEQRRVKDVVANLKLWVHEHRDAGMTHRAQDELSRLEAQ